MTDIRVLFSIKVTICSVLPVKLLPLPLTFLALGNVPVRTGIPSKPPYQQLFITRLVFNNIFSCLFELHKFTCKWFALVILSSYSFTTLSNIFLLKPLLLSVLFSTLRSILSRCCHVAVFSLLLFCVGCPRSKGSHRTRRYQRPGGKFYSFCIARDIKFCVFLQWQILT